MAPLQDIKDIIDSHQQILTDKYKKCCNEIRKSIIGPHTMESIAVFRQIILDLTINHSLLMDDMSNTCDQKVQTKLTPCHGVTRMDKQCVESIIQIIDTKPDRSGNVFTDHFDYLMNFTYCKESTPSTILWFKNTAANFCIYHLNSLQQNQSLYTKQIVSIIDSYYQSKQEPSNDKHMSIIPRPVLESVPTQLTITDIPNLPIKNEIRTRSNSPKPSNVELTDVAAQVFGVRNDLIQQCEVTYTHYIHKLLQQKQIIITEILNLCDKQCCDVMLHQGINPNYIPQTPKVLPLEMLYSSLFATDIKPQIHTHEMKVSNVRTKATKYNKHSKIKTDESHGVRSKKRKKRKSHKNQNDKPWKCKFCGRGFTRNHHCIRHERLHTGEKPFVCEYENCNERFHRTDYLKRHVDRYHNEDDDDDYSSEEETTKALNGWIENMAKMDKNAHTKYNRGQDKVKAEL
eukprot:155131_1